MYFFFFNDTATTEIYTLSLHDALPISGEDITHGLPRVVELFEARTPKGKAVLARTSGVVRLVDDEVKGRIVSIVGDDGNEEDRKSTRLNSSHANISYAVFCLKKKKTNT